MNLLRTVTLTAIFVKCVIAGPQKSKYIYEYISQPFEMTPTEGNLDLMPEFHQAVGKGDMTTTVQLYSSIFGYWEEKLDYIVGKKDQDFIFEFARKVKSAKADLLAALHRNKKPREMIEKALQVLELSQYDLVGAASKLELMCFPKDLFYLLDRIEERKDQERAISDGVGYLFINNRTECLEPLLIALEGSGSLKHLRDVAVKKVFEKGSERGNMMIVKRFYDDPAITSKDYALGVINAGYESMQNPIFNFLLGEADKDDLNAVKEHKYYAARPKEFKDAIDKALLSAKPGGDRLIRRDIQRAELVMETFDENRDMRMPTVISQLIAFYVIDESILKPILDSIKRTISDSVDETAYMLAPDEFKALLKLVLNFQLAPPKKINSKNHKKRSIEEVD